MDGGPGRPSERQACYGDCDESTKSIAQISFGCVADYRSSRSFALTQRFGVLIRNCTPISRYTDRRASDSPAILPEAAHMDTTIAIAHAGGGDLPDACEPARLDVSGSGRLIARLATQGKHVECSLAKSHEHDSPVAASGQASKLSADHVLQHLLVAVLLAPIVVGRLADPRLAADLANRCAFLALPQNSAPP